MNRKFIILGALLALFIIVLILFLTVGRKSTQKTATPSSNKLVIWDSFDTETDLSEAIAAFKVKNPTMDVAFVKKNPATYETDSLNAIASGTGPDIWVIPNTWMPKHHGKLAELPLKKLDSAGKKDNASAYKDTYLPVAYLDNVYDSNVYGIPLFIDSLSLFYNSSLLNEKFQKYIKDHPDVDRQKARTTLLEPPKTWDDVTSFVKAYGQDSIALGAGSNIDRSSDILTTLMIQYGAQMTSEDKTTALFHTATNLFNTDVAYPGAKALTFYTSFAKAGDANQTWTKDKDNAYKAFVKGQLAMMLDYPQISSKIKKDSGEEPSTAKLPQVLDTENPVSLAYYQTFTVPKGSANIQKAWEFILSLSDSQILNKYLANKKLSNPLKEETQNSTNFLDIQNNYATSWYNPEPAKVNQVFVDSVSQVLDGQNPQTVLEGAAAQVTKMLQTLKEQK